MSFADTFVAGMAAIIIAIGYRGWEERLTFTRRRDL